MAVRIDFDEADNVVRVRATGTVTRDLLEDAFAQLEALALRPGYRELVDLRAVRRVDVAGSYLRAVAARFNRMRPDAMRGARHAIVAPSNAGYGMARMFELSRGDTEDEMRVFRGLDEARAWLGLRRRSPVATSAPDREPGPGR